MTLRDQLLKDGVFAKKQLYCKDRVIAWSHLRRFQMGRRLVSEFAGKRLLDYGCGDGTFLALNSDHFPDGVGADLDAKEVARTAERLAEIPGISFRLIEELQTPSHDRLFDVVTCMEVLEHCVPENEARVLSDLQRLVSPTGSVIVSVPAEIGGSLLIKQAWRTIAGWRRLGDYRYNEIYRIDELLKMVLATRRTQFSRPIYGEKLRHYGHKGFNWRALRDRLKQHFLIERTHFTPVGWLGGFVASQAWFVCKVKSDLRED
jgi:2-polyprenyl-3-methyl-5-hydroxy-6-metoxy-1,4-benzoquinol methylase